LKFQYDKNVNQSGKTGQITGEHPALPIRKDSIELASLPTTDSASSTFKNEQAIIRERGERNHSKTGAIEHEHKHSSVPISTYWAWILRLHNHQDGLDMVAEMLSLFNYLYFSVHTQLILSFSLICSESLLFRPSCVWSAFQTFGMFSMIKVIRNYSFVFFITEICPDILLPP